MHKKSLRNSRFLYIIFIYFLSYFWLCWISVAACGLSSCSKQGLLSSCGVLASHCRGFSYRGAWALEHRLNSHGTLAQLLHGMWDPPRSGVEPMSPASAGRFFTTEPSGKPSW